MSNQGYYGNQETYGYSRQPEYTNVLQILFDERISDERKAFLKKCYSERTNHPNDSGYDLIMPDDSEHTVNTRHRVGLGIKCRMLTNGVPSPFDIQTRSSFDNYPFVMSNPPALIDVGYRGEVAVSFRCVQDDNVVFVNGIPEQKKDNFKLIDGKITVPAGARLFQAVHANRKPITLEFVSTFDEARTSRDGGGFGSTTKQPEFSTESRQFTSRSFIN